MLTVGAERDFFFLFSFPLKQKSRCNAEIFSCSFHNLAGPFPKGKIINFHTGLLRSFKRMARFWSQNTFMPRVALQRKGGGGIAQEICKLCPDIASRDSYDRACRCTYTKLISCVTLLHVINKTEFVAWAGSEGTFQHNV
jgi:hypothetical protein